MSKSEAVIIIVNDKITIIRIQNSVNAIYIISNDINSLNFVIIKSVILSRPSTLVNVLHNCHIHYFIDQIHVSSISDTDFSLILTGILKSIRIEIIFFIISVSMF